MSKGFNAAKFLEELDGQHTFAFTRFNDHVGIDRCGPVKTVTVDSVER